MYAVVVPYYQLLLAIVGYSRTEIGLLLGSFELFGIVGSLFLGVLADRTGKFRLVVGLSTAVAALILLQILSAPPILTALVISSLFGLGFKANVPLFDALSGHLLPDPDHDYGRVRMWGSVAFTLIVIGIGRTGLMNTGVAPSMFIPMISAIGFFLLFSQFILVDPKGRGIRSATDSSERVSPWLYVIVGTIFLINFGFAAYTSFFSLYLVTEVGIRHIAVCLGRCAGATASRRQFRRHAYRRGCSCTIALPSASTSCGPSSLQRYRDGFSPLHRRRRWWFHCRTIRL